MTQAETPELVKIVAGESLAVIARCPSCDQSLGIVGRITARLTRDQDGDSSIALRLRAPRAPHLCGQLTLEVLEGGRGDA